MYKIGDELINKKEHIGFKKNNIYQIKSIKGKCIVLIDDDKESRFISSSAIDNNFKLINKLNESDNKLKNPKASHYNLWLDTDSIDIIKANLTQEEYIGALKFNILKYQLRLGKKDCIKSDMEKIEDYKRELNDILGKR